MAKKSILHGMEIRNRRLRGLMWGMVLLCYSLLLSPLYAKAETCTEIDFNKPTIAAGLYHTAGLKEDGTVVVVGDNTYGQLNVSDWTNIKAIAAGWYHTVGLKEDGTAVAAGWNRDGQLNVSDWSNIKAIAAGPYHTVGLKEDGTVVATGWNYWGQLNVSDWTNIKAIAVGPANTVGIKKDGSVVFVGWDQWGYLNVSDWINIKAIAIGSEHVIGLKADGTVVAKVTPFLRWYNITFDVSDWTNIRAIASRGVYAVGLKEDGTVVRTGWDGILNVSNWANIKAIAAGAYHTVGLMEDGTVMAAGLNWYGVLDVSDWTNIRQPSCANNPPVANAGSDQVMECDGPSGSSVTLNGSGTSDLDSDPLTYIWLWDGGTAEGINPTVTLPVGTTVVTLSVSDGKDTATDTVSITVQDTTPPVTTATGGSENWYNANVISTFSATDSCSGLKEIHYTVNGTETVVSSDSTSLTLTTDGIYNIAYYSIDNAGNAESPNSMTVKIDKTPPVLSLSTNTNTLWPPNRKMTDVTIGGNATDATSGIASVAFTVTDEYGIVQPSISNFNSTVQLEAWREGTDKDGRHYTITAVATDAAGNKTTKTTTVLVPHDQGIK